MLLVYSVLTLIAIVFVITMEPGFVKTLIIITVLALAFAAIRAKL